MLNKQTIVGIILAIVIGVALAWAAAGWLATPQLGATYQTQYSPSLLPEGGDFTLNSDQGEVKLSDFKGKVVVMYFGYTACPDVCPTSMGTMKAAFNLLTPEQLKQVQGLLVSIDPERDTLQQVNRYAQYFHPNIRGVSSRSEDLEQIARQYHAFFRKVPLPDSALGYMMDHTSTLYVIDKEGKVQKLIEHAVPPAELAAAIKALL
ncbi:SCO family protein [Thiofilum flexile]|uniref:SCO family protein n=1 Tax=Thiofilum flexile TaxID=125627 RepID=UPI00037BB7DD|nr:SCO family protein [Thiofilum flexile]